MEIKEPRILLWDIETSHNIVAVFTLRNQDWIHPENILQERYVICASWKWLGEDEVHSVSVLDNPKLFAKDPHNDRHVIETLHGVLAQADAIVHHNGNAFDNKFVETRILAQGMEPLPPIQHIDTLKVAKSRFLFNSNSLDYLGKLLNVGQKSEHPSGMWLNILKGGPAAKEAIKNMVTYNKVDVTLLERVFLKLRPYMADYLNRQLFTGAKSACPRCGSLKIHARGTHKAISRTYQRFQCQECGGWFKEVKPVVAPKATLRVI